MRPAGTVTVSARRPTVSASVAGAVVDTVANAGRPGVNQRSVSRTIAVVRSAGATGAR